MNRNGADSRPPRKRWPGWRPDRNCRTRRSWPECVLFHDQGQFAAAEQLINDAAADPRNDTAHVRVLLVPIFSQLGRLDEAQRLLEEWWEHLNEMGEGASERAIDQVRMHIELAFKPNPVETSARISTRPIRWPPTMTASGWVERTWRSERATTTRRRAGSIACLKRRPDDVPVWSAWLKLGIASNRIDLVQQALTHLPADASTDGTDPPARRLALLAPG